ncbi:DnaD domain protein [Paenibacillus sp. Marseille-Q4541]|uniref:DnaD domain-containing protein n=1 Tax=Paenibacillus sp. Marseille-Q4541 TaxID=2831522 RepID=UPI001BA62F9F|nr:DnaD domain protein [Paenibacillus sp. Marseille-Q4541]
MAEKRMISKVISISEKVNDLPNIFSMLLFTWMIPHTDDFGRLAGSPSKVKALVVPMLDKKKEEVAAALEELATHGLINWYEVDGERVIQILNFDKHQQGLHKRTRSKFPDFPGSSDSFPKIPLEEKRTELKRTEEKGIELEQISGSSSQNDSSINPYRIFEEEGFGTISSILKDQIDDLVNTYTIVWYKEAIKRAVLQGRRTLSYVNGILKNWKSRGMDEPWKGDGSGEEYEGRAERNRSGRAQKESEFAHLDS